MDYKVENRSYPEFEKDVIDAFDILHDEPCCPECGFRMGRTHETLDEEYTTGGRFELKQRYYCENCNTFADVTQVYRPAERRVTVHQDVFEEE